MKKPIFTGSGVAIITPFTEDGVNYNKMSELIEMHIAQGTDAIIVCGTTGESATMPDEEHKEVIRFTVEKAAGRIPVIAGTGSNDTAHAVRRFAYCDSVLQQDDAEGIVRAHKADRRQREDPDHPLQHSRQNGRSRL